MRKCDFFSECFNFFSIRGAGSSAERSEKGLVSFEGEAVVCSRHLERWENELTREMQVELQGVSY